MTTKPAPKTSKTPRHRKVAAPTFAPLSLEERSNAYDFIDLAHTSNRRVLTAAGELEEARRAFDVARQDLEIATADYANARAENQRIHAELAPLLHRLPA